MTPKNSRIRALRKIMREAHCDALLVSDVIDVAYLSGFLSTNAFVLLTGRHCLLISDFRYRSAATQFCERTPGWRFAEINESGWNFLATYCPAGTRVAIQSESLTLDQYDALRAASRRISFVKVSGRAGQVSMVKTAAEIHAMRTAAAIADKALVSALHTVRLGIRELELAATIDRYCLQHGAQGPSFDTIVLFGKRTALPHGRPSPARLRRGDWILVDFGCRHDDFCSDMTRTMVAGEASAAQRELYATVLQAQTNARRQARAGISAADLDRSARAVIENAGYGPRFGHATGHGVGRRIHEKPRIHSRDSTILQPGMVVTIEPGIYLPESGGVRIEDMVEITADGSRILTRTPRRLLEISV